MKNNNEHKEEYKRTAGIQAPMPGDEGNPPEESILPALVRLIIIVISITFFAMLIQGFITVFGP